MDPNKQENVLARGYIYPTTNQRYFMIIEPYDGNEETRMALLPEDTINNIPKQAENGTELNKLVKQFWEKEVAKYYAFSQDEFRRTDNTHVIKHRGEEEYIESLKAIIDCVKTGERPRIKNRAVNQRVALVYNRIIRNIKSPCVQHAVMNAIKAGEVGKNDLAMAELALGQTGRSYENPNNGEVAK